jgi:hypothetical protein
MVPGCLLRASQSLTAIAANVEAVPKRWWPQACPASFPAARVALGLDGLRDPRQGVELRQDADDGLARAVARDECRRHAGDAGLDREPRVPQLLLEERRALRFLVADLGEVPDLQRRALGPLTVLVDETGNVALGILRHRHRRDQGQRSHRHRAHLAFRHSVLRFAESIEGTRAFLWLSRRLWCPKPLIAEHAEDALSTPSACHTCNRGWWHAGPRAR